jgi:hypothetical protein
MSDEPSPAGPWTTAASWIAMVFACGSAVAVALFISADRPSYASLFRDFKVDLPEATTWFLSVPNSALVAVAAALAALAGTAQCVRFRRGGATAVHLAVMLCAALAFGLYCHAMLQPFGGILWSVAGPEKR